MKKPLDIYEERFGIEKKAAKKSVCRLTLIILCVILGVLTIYVIGNCVQNAIRSLINNLTVTDDLNAIWIASLASYWGGILGGIISGILTVMGVAWTIKYYKRSDVEKSQKMQMPFLMAEVNECNIIKSVIENDVFYEIDSQKIKKDNQQKEKAFFCEIRLKNIGQGFASTITINTGKTIGGESFLKVIPVNCDSAFCFKIRSTEKIQGDEIRFAISYVDCVTNEYIQEYCVRWKSESLNDVTIQQGYPIFLGQVYDIGK